MDKDKIYLQLIDRERINLQGTSKRYMASINADQGQITTTKINMDSIPESARCVALARQRGDLAHVVSEIWENDKNPDEGQEDRTPNRGKLYRRFWERGYTPLLKRRHGIGIADDSSGEIDVHTIWKMDYNSSGELIVRIHPKSASKKISLRDGQLHTEECPVRVEINTQKINGKSLIYLTRSELRALTRS